MQIVIMVKHVVLVIKLFMFEYHYPGVELASGKLLGQGDKMIGSAPQCAAIPFISYYRSRDKA